MTDIAHTSFVYKWTHTTTGKWYIGVRTAKGCHPDDGYLTSSKLVKSLIENFPEEWEREILQTGESIDMLNFEASLLEELDAKNDIMSYNQHNGDGKFTRTGVSVPLETRQRQSESIKRIHPNRGKPSPNKGKRASDETKEKQRLAKLGKRRKPFSVDTKEKIRQSKLGSNNPSYGKSPSDETREKLRLANLGSKQLLVCPHCGKIGGGGSMTRWHFGKCKENTIGDGNELG